jgi:hypothetical protein
MCTATGAHAVPTSLGHRRRATVLCVFLAAAALSSAGLAPPAFAQGASSATLRGVVTDSSGGVLPGAEVTLVNVRTAGRRRATTGSAGTYVFVALASGDYRVKVGLPGFRPWESAELHLSPGDSLEVEARLEVGAQTEQTKKRSSSAPSLASESMFGVERLELP